MKFKEQFNKLNKSWFELRPRIEFTIKALQAANIKFFPPDYYWFSGEVPDVVKDEITGADTLACKLVYSSYDEADDEAMVFIPLKCFDHENAEAIVAEYTFNERHRKELEEEKCKITAERRRAAAKAVAKKIRENKEAEEKAELKRLLKKYGNPIEEE